MSRGVPDKPVQPATGQQPPEAAAGQAGKIIRPTSYRAFWPLYLELHRDTRSRAMHFAGSLAAAILLVWALVAGPLWLALLVPVAGYAAAWLGHLLLEGNRPATFGYPLWSLVSDYRMLGLWLAGRLEGEYRRRGLS